MVNFIAKDSAFKILGEKRFLSPERIISAWDGIIKQHRTDHNIKLLERPHRKLKIRFPEDVIKQTIKKDRSWYLVYDPGFSLRNIQAIFGSNHGHQPRQYPGNDWWFSSGNPWTEKKEEPNYYFVKLETILSGKSWKAQEEEILKNKLFYRVPSRLIISIQISYFLLYGSYIAGHSHHWGPELDSHGKVGCVSNVGSNGFILYNWNCDLPDEGEGIGVFIAHKFEVEWHE